MAINKKIIGATPHEYNGIKFKSALEVTVYKTLLQEGFNPKYEKQTFTIWEGFNPTIPFITKDAFKRKDYRIVSVGRWSVIDNRPCKDITYTPDFVMQYGNTTVVIEVKGYENDVFPYKFKMFRKHLESLNGNYELWEIFTKRQLQECINRLRTSAGM